MISRHAGPLAAFKIEYPLGSVRRFGRARQPARQGETVAPGEDALLLLIQPSSERYAHDDDRWLAQQVELYSDLRREVGGVRRETVALTGQKGAVETVILALASAGSVTAAVQCLRDWLTRDRTRVVEIVYTVDGRDERIILRGTHVDDATARQLTEVALSRWRTEE
jgi:hypothetical protein